MNIGNITYKHGHGDPKLAGKRHRVQESSNLPYLDSKIVDSGLLDRNTQEIDQINSLLNEEAIFSTFEIDDGAIQSSSKNNRLNLSRELLDFWNNMGGDLIDILFEATIRHPEEEGRRRALIALSELKTVANRAFPYLAPDISSRIEYQVHHLKRISSQIQDENDRGDIDGLIKQMVDLGMIDQRGSEIHPDIQDLLENEHDFPTDTSGLEEEEISRLESALDERLEEMLNNPEINLAEDLLNVALESNPPFSERALLCLERALTFKDPGLRRIVRTQLSNWTDKLLSTESDGPFTTDVANMIRKVILPSSDEECQEALSDLRKVSDNSEISKIIINHIFFKRACLCLTELTEDSQTHDPERTQRFLENTMLSGILSPKVVGLMLNKCGTSEFLPSDLDFYDTLIETYSSPEVDHDPSVLSFTTPEGDGQIIDTIFKKLKDPNPEANEKALDLLCKIFDIYAAQAATAEQSLGEGDLTSTKPKFPQFITLTENLGGIFAKEPDVPKSEFPRTAEQAIELLMHLTNIFSPNVLEYAMDAFDEVTTSLIKNASDDMALYLLEKIVLSKLYVFGEDFEETRSRIEEDFETLRNYSSNAPEYQGALNNIENGIEKIGEDIANQSQETTQNYQQRLMNIHETDQDPHMQDFLEQLSKKMIWPIEEYRPEFLVTLYSASNNPGILETLVEIFEHSQDEGICASLATTYESSKNPNMLYALSQIYEIAQDQATCENILNFLIDQYQALAESGNVNAKSVLKFLIGMYEASENDSIFESLATAYESSTDPDILYALSQIYEIAQDPSAREYVLNFLIAQYQALAENEEVIADDVLGLLSKMYEVSQDDGICEFLVETYENSKDPSILYALSQIYEVAQDQATCDIIRDFLIEQYQVLVENEEVTADDVLKLLSEMYKVSQDEGICEFLVTTYENSKDPSILYALSQVYEVAQDQTTCENIRDFLIDQYQVLAENEEVTADDVLEFLIEMYRISQDETILEFLQSEETCTSVTAAYESSKDPNILYTLSRIYEVAQDQITCDNIRNFLIEQYQALAGNEEVTAKGVLELLVRMHSLNPQDPVIHGFLEEQNALPIPKAAWDEEGEEEEEEAEIEFGSQTSSREIDENFGSEEEDQKEMFRSPGASLGASPQPFVEDDTNVPNSMNVTSLEPKVKRHHHRHHQVQQEQSQSFLVKAVDGFFRATNGIRDIIASHIDYFDPNVNKKGQVQKKEQIQYRSQKDFIQTRLGGAIQECGGGGHCMVLSVLRQIDPQGFDDAENRFAMAIQFRTELADWVEKNIVSQGRQPSQDEQASINALRNIYPNGRGEYLDVNHLIGTWISQYTERPIVVFSTAYNPGVGNLMGDDYHYGMVNYNNPDTEIPGNAIVLYHDYSNRHYQAIV